MKLILFSAREDEKVALETYQKMHPEIELDIYTEAIDENTMSYIKKGYDGLIASQVKAIPEEAYHLMKESGIKVFATRSAGFDMYNLKLLKELGIRFTRVPVYSPFAIAEFAFTSAMYFSRDFDIIHRNVQEGDFRWQNSITSTEIRHKTVGIVGTGNIGRLAAKLFKEAGATVMGYDLYPNKALEDILTYVSTVEELVEKSDIISLHAPATEENYHLFDADLLKHAKKNLILVNAARGSLVDTKALLDALDNNQIRAAAIDTYEHEGPFVNRKVSLDEVTDELFLRLLKHPKVLYSPHVAFHTHTAIENLVHIAIDGAKGILLGEEVKEELKLD
ncbi:D-2-hydroxyacid dehydrogenase [Streptococcus zalophi]|uniref:D-2-hydroxyacid dehydrogenase n=1 Tax=Streptococcus zalophi TaxID=640031 RepID=A0A934P8T4_9STRE|nr:D-2-hydroxyacid dehydrogenase [Streptococcus zalophi]MBJ8349057.1 D-2-hydroxyacid dehydrogenase [Streptococcus zalophi]MCR8967792.1 D-2-hydroxyacid dehydrogenase [Streptococcus zalophi]